MSTSNPFGSIESFFGAVTTKLPLVQLLIDLVSKGVSDEDLAAALKGALVSAERRHLAAELGADPAQDAAKEIQRISDLYDAAVGDIRGKDAEIASLEDDLTVANAIIEHHKNKIETLQDALTASEADLEATKAKVNELETDLARERDHVAALVDPDAVGGK